MLRQVSRITSILACMAFAAQGASAVTIERVVPRLLEQQDFTSITEYFTGEESPMGRTVLRSDTSRRDGYYFVVTLAEPVSRLPQGTSVLLDYIPASTGKEASLRLPLAGVERNGHLLYIGLTDPEWSESPAILAWRIRIVGPDDAVLAHEQSFLWELP